MSEENISNDPARFDSERTANTNAGKDPNEIQTVSLLKKNLRLFKRLALGKKTPPFLLKWTCLIFLSWDLLMIIFLLLLSLFTSLAGIFYEESAGDVLTLSYVFSYMILHVVSLVGVLLAWRKKLTGFYIYAIANGLMPFWRFIMDGKMDWDLTVFVFTAVAIGMFAINWRTYTVNVKKREINKIAKKEAKRIAKEQS